MRFTILLYYWTIIVGGWLIFLGWPPREPICIVCTPTLTLIAGLVSVVLGVAGLAQSFRGRESVAAR